MIIRGWLRVKTIDTFLNELQNKINSFDEPINDYENKRNELMEIQNILYAHNIVKKEITLDDLLSFSNEEVKRIIAIVDKEKADSLFKAFLVYKPLILNYESIKEKFGENFEAPQYLEAVRWLNELAKRTNAHLRDFEGRNEVYINSLKEKNIDYKKFYNLFKGEELISLLSEFKKFDKLLDELNFNDEEKGRIKKLVGIGNIKLFNAMCDDSSNNDEKSSEKSITEFVDSELKTNDDSLINPMQDETYNVKDENVIDIDNQLIINEDATELKSEESIENASNNLESIEVSENDDIGSKSKINNIENNVEDDDCVIQAQEILSNEQDLINSINEQEFSEFLAQSINSDSKDYVKYQIVAILIALNSDLEKYHNFYDVPSTRDISLTNIKKFIEVYRTLKDKLNNE